MDLQTHLTELRELIERQLHSDIALSNDCPQHLADAVRYSLLAPGKRIRPCLVLLACEACQGKIEAALPAASAIEMIHCYSLIHDDLPAMDDDDLRRGRPTNHIQFGEPTAILAGDGLLTRAFEVLARSPLSAETRVQCLIDLASAAGLEGMVGGQQADLEAESHEQTSLEQLEAIHRRKTGRLLAASLTLGGRVAGADTQTLRNLTIYGESVGLAFQIADDLLDVLGHQDKIGKGTRKDAELGKQTYPSLLGIEESRRKANDLVAQARAALTDFGEQGGYLSQLAGYIIERDH